MRQLDESEILRWLLPEVGEVRPMDLTNTQLMRFIELGYTPPTSALTGRGELRLVDDD